MREIEGELYVGTIQYWGRGNKGKQKDIGTGEE
jgi:hypothetical protein